MKIAIILNGISIKKKFFYNKFLPPVKERFDLSVFETKHQSHAYELAEGCSNSFDVIIAAGGDGTLHQVVNGIVRNGKDGRLPTIGLIPLGTGNDFARTCGIKADPLQLISLLERNEPLPTDLGHVTCQDENQHEVERHFINVCSMGMGPEVVKRLSGSSRKLGPSLTYLKSIIATFFTHKPQQITVETPAWQWIGNARVVAIANGRSFGNSLYIAPDAKIDDGPFSTFIVGELALFRFLIYLQMIKKGGKIRDLQVHYNNAHQVQLTSPLPTLIEAEGELIGWLPATIKIKNARVNFLR